MRCVAGFMQTGNSVMNCSIFEGRIHRLNAREW